MREPRLALQFGVGAHGGWQYTESGPTGSEWGGQQQGPGMELSWEACFLLAVGGTQSRQQEVEISGWIGDKGKNHEQKFKRTRKKRLNLLLIFYFAAIL